MKNKIIFVFLLLVTVFLVSAETSKVYIVSLNYKDGLLTINDKIVKFGYSPDRKIQPETGYRADVVAVDNSVLYSFKFKVPLERYVDVSINDSLSGGIVKLNSTDFALVVPYFDNAKQINFYSEENIMVSSVDVYERKKLEVNNSYLIVGIVILLIILFLLLRFRKK